MNVLSFRQRLICWLAYLVTRAFHATYRYEWFGLENYSKACSLSASSHPVIACWHQNALGSVLSHAHRRLGVIVSRSFDGEIISSVAARFGIASARGSSHRGGLEALREVVKLIKNAHDAGITVDGPTGPRHQVKPGVVSIASLTGSAIVPFAAIGLRSWSFTKSWDQFRLPQPFTRIICLYGPPIAVPRRLDKAGMESIRLQVESSLMALEDELAQGQEKYKRAKPDHKGMRPSHGPKRGMPASQD